MRSSVCQRHISAFCRTSLHDIAGSPICAGVIKYINALFWPGRADLALTHDFKETIRARVARDPKFRKELLREGIECMLTGDIATAKIILRDYINATVGFTELAEATHIPSKSLMRMLGPAGNPRADNLFLVVSFLQRREGVCFQVKAVPR
jgi:DNA-binding phage protein